MANPSDVARGVRIRAAIQRTVLPRLAPGAPVPSSIAMGRALGITHGNANRHLRRVLREAGVVTRKAGRVGRVVVEIKEPVA